MLLIIIYSPPHWWKVKWNLVVHENIYGSYLNPLLSWRSYCSLETKIVSAHPVKVFFLFFLFYLFYFSRLGECCYCVLLGSSRNVLLITNVRTTFHSHEGEKMMTEFLVFEGYSSNFPIKLPIFKGLAWSKHFYFPVHQDVVVLSDTALYSLREQGPLVV